MDKLVSTQQSIIKYLKKIIGDNNGDPSILNSIDEHIQNIKINAESVNLNTDELESKLDEISNKIPKNLLDAINRIDNNLIIFRSEFLNNKVYLNPRKVEIPNIGNFTKSNGFVVYNNTDNDLILNCIPLNNGSIAIDMKFVPGWNPLICKQVTVTEENTVMIGY